MARIVGGIGTTHVPSIGNAIAKGLQRDPYWKPFFDGFAGARKWLAQVRPDVVVVLYNDHGLNFFLDKLPTFAVGAANEYKHADEGWGLPVSHPYPGDPPLSWHLIESLVADEFDVTTCQEMLVDHAFTIPLALLWPEPDTRAEPSSSARPRWRAKRAASAATPRVRAPDTRPEPSSSARPRWRAKRAASAATPRVRAPDTRPEPSSSARAVRTVPIAINTVQHPLPSPARCFKLGQAIGRAIESYAADVNVLVLGTGGLSHQLDGKRAGFINKEFDLMCLDKLVSDPQALAAYSSLQIVEQAGSQGVELLNWIAMRGALTGDVSRVHGNYHVPISNTASALLVLENRTSAATTYRKAS
jgi:aromatic ring-opening dioxygenase catalytic subunit (LigB family)